nr:uncharacterized protein LOC117692708 isoform X2 [Crassostrea gigas]
MENFSTGISESMQHVSESMFRGLSLIVGTSQQVAIRRETNDIEEMVSRQIGVNGLSTMLSGSRREGFRLKGSDFDVMVWPNEIRVATDVSQSVYYDDSFNTVLLLSDSSESPPGFTLLQLMIPTEAADLNRDFPLFEKMHGNFYISCSFYKKWLREVSLSTPHILTEHGPCGNAIIYGTEWDLAPCFVCDFWPPSASSWIERCHSWPDPEIVDDIVRGGCHFVAIGHPLGQHEHLEWRISFSQAEQKCVYAMNHSQFLTYGLLKLFLKEVINQQHQETNELLCSYHMKTAVLWAIQQNTLTHWCPQNLLVGFWTCFKLLIKWVYEGFCPNFFIPKNNLFLSKIYGSSQKSLFLQMHEWYRKGFGCLLQCSSISSCIIDVMYNPRLSILIDENVMCCEADYDKELLNAINLLNISMEKLPRALWIVEQLIGSHLTQYQAH